MGIFDIFRKKTPDDVPDESSENDSATRHCFVLCKSAERGDLSRAGDVVARVFGRGYSVDVGDGDVVTILRKKAAIGFLAHMPAPIPGGEAEDNADGNFLWPDGKEDAARHASHVIVTNIGAGNQSPIQSALVVSKLALVALDLYDSIGVYWGNASVCNSRGIFEDFCDGMSEEQLPVPIWLRFQVVRTKDDEVGFYTLGMQQFDLMEIEIDRCTMDLEDVFDFVSNLAHYLIQSGPVIADGNTVGGDENERILVRHRPSMIDADKTVYKIVFE